MRWHTESIDFASEEGMLHGEILLPKGEGPFPGAVLCHGLGVDHRAMRPSAQRLTRRSIATLTFDFRGHGKSEGVLDENMARDVIAAIKLLRRHPKVDAERIALVGHSLGAGAAMLAAPKLRNLQALVSISSPSEVKGQLGGLLALLYREIAQLSGAIIEYPRGGALPGLGRLQGVISRLWMWMRGYRLRINWQSTLQISPKLNSIALEQMVDFPKLFVHCKGDTVVPYEGALELYDRAHPPKEFLLSKGGFHSTPLFPGKLRGKWIAWLVSTLNQAKGGSVGLAGEIQI